MLAAEISDSKHGSKGGKKISKGAVLKFSPLKYVYLNYTSINK